VTTLGERSGMRLVVALNETQIGCQEGVRAALDRSLEAGRVEAVAVYPFLSRENEGASSETLVAELLAEIRDLNANALLWVHTSTTHVSASAIADIRSALKDGVVGYWEGDWYLAFRKPLPRAALRLMVGSDVVFLCGEGGLSKSIARAGAQDLRYVPLPTDHRFGPIVQQGDFACEVVMVANRVRSRVPFKSLPGSIMRERVVRLFSERLGGRFWVYGHGWSGPSAQGPLGFVEQAQAYSAARVVLGTNNCYARFYFSDRLPIAMSCGRPVVYYRDEGYEEIFGADSGVYWFKTPEQAWSMYESVVANPQAAQARASAGRRLAESLLTMSRAVDYILEVMSATRRQDSLEVPNPWIPWSRLES
jgi:hypothetical protein